jgi:ring-1,2-phenylacetyl-CoA epoxidase subunit PaaE
MGTNSTLFHSLKIRERREETKDAFSLSLMVPGELREQFKFAQGQYLTLRATVDGDELRRSYSICVGEQRYRRNGELRVGIKRVEGGRFSEYAYRELQAGSSIEVMAPAGRFTSALEPTKRKHYLGVAAGSGITPILSFIETCLAGEPSSQFTLVYGNRSTDQVMFLEAIESLKNQFMQRFQVIYCLSAQSQEIELFNGRITGAKIKAMIGSVLPENVLQLSQVMVCGPDSMIDEVTDSLVAAGLPKERILSERFGTPSISANKKPRAAVSIDPSQAAKLEVILGGKNYPMPFAYVGPMLLDVALEKGLDLPYACKGGVCCTCRAKVLEGEVKMEKNYTLEDWEVKQGFVLTCQCSPVTDRVVVSFDER